MYLCSTAYSPLVHKQAMDPPILNIVVSWSFYFYTFFLSSSVPSEGRLEAEIGFHHVDEMGYLDHVRFQVYM